MHLIFEGVIWGLLIATALQEGNNWKTAAVFLLGPSVWGLNIQGPIFYLAMIGCLITAYLYAKGV